MSRSSSTTSLRPREPSYARLPKNPNWNKSNPLGTKKIDEKGDASSGELGQASKPGQQSRSLQKKQSTVRKQRSDPILTIKASPGKNRNRSAQQTGEAGESYPPSVKESISRESLAIVEEELSAPEYPETEDDGRICEALKDDPQLCSLCTSIGLSLHPDTLVGPIEKGQLIIGVLQDSLNELIKLKVRSAERKGDLFHIQQSGLDVAIRALENADRSLKTMKASKEPILGLLARSRSQQSLESEQKTRLHQKQTQAVIRILSTTKEKFDKMGYGLNKFMTGLSFLSTRSGTSTMPSSDSSSAGASRRTTGISLLTTPVTPMSGKAGSTRAKSSISSTSIGSRNGNMNTRKMPSSILF